MSTQLATLLNHAKSFQLDEQMALVSELSRHLLSTLNASQLRLQDANEKLVGYVYASNDREWNEDPAWLDELKSRAARATPGTGKSFDEVMARVKAQYATR